MRRRDERPRGSVRPVTPSRVFARAMSTPAAILAVMRASRPRCRDSGDVLAYALHAATMAEGYRLLAAGPAAETPESARTDPNADPSEGWTAWEGAYAFRYARERTVDAASPSSSNRPSGAEAPSAPPHHEILVKSMVVGDAMLVSALVSRVGDASPSESPPVRTAEFSLAAHVEPAAAAADAAASLRRVDELAARAAKEIFKPLLADAGAGDGDASPGTYPGTSARGDAKGADRAVEGYPRPPPEYPPWPDDARASGRYPPGVPPLGARFDPYGPPDIPEFAPGRFDAGPRFPDNPDAIFGGVPDGSGGWTGGPGTGPGRGRGRGAGDWPPGWPRGRGRGFDPDLGFPPGGFGGGPLG